MNPAAKATLAMKEELDRAGQLADRCQLLDADHMPHAGVEPHRDGGAHPLEDLARLDHAWHRDMRVDVAAAEEDRRVVEAAGVLARHAVRPDQSTAQPYDRAVSARVPRRPLEREAGTLGEAEPGHALRRHPRLDAFDKPREHVQRC